MPVPKPSLVPFRVASLLAALLSPLASMAAADLEAGKSKAQAVCAACHGANGVSVSDAIPNLAGQRGAYLEAQLKAWKDGSRKNAIMNAIGAQWGGDEISNLAPYFASLPPGGGAEKSALLLNVNKTNLAFPEGYKTSYTKYLAINFPVTKQVRYCYANPVAAQAAKAGKPVPDGSLGGVGEVAHARKPRSIG